MPRESAGGRLPKGVSAQGCLLEVSVQGEKGVCRGVLGGSAKKGGLPGGCLPGSVCPGGCLPDSPLNRIRERCKNITLPQLHCGQ